MRNDAIKREELAAWVALNKIAAKGTVPTGLDVTEPVEATNLERLASLHSVAYDLDGMIERTVQAALDAGETWAAIGASLGVSRQSAHEKWSKRLKAAQLPI